MRSGDAGERSARLRPNGRWVRLTSSEQRTGQPNAVDVSGSESQIRGLGGPVRWAADFRFRPQTDSTAARAGGKLGNFGGFATPSVTQRNAQNQM
jgi:hypothetical protein